jgi:hypothetical protein
MLTPKEASLSATQSFLFFVRGLKPTANNWICRYATKEKRKADFSAPPNIMLFISMREWLYFLALGFNIPNA